MDIIIKNGKIVDGTGNPWYFGDIGIKNDKISLIKKNIEKECEHLINAHGKIVCPGFIDAHTHSDLAAITNKAASNYLTQGVTTNVIGNCGWSAAPLNPNTVGDLLSLIAPDINTDLTKLWQSFGDFLDFLEKTRFTINLVPLLGHGTLRIAVMGLDKGKPNNTEMDKMKELVKNGMESGAFGISAGLEYMPGIFTKPKELIELCKMVAIYDGVFSIHIRDEGNLGGEAVDEAIYIAQNANVSLQISHLKLDGKNNWGKAEQRLEQLEKARENGIDVTTDVYPYTFCMTNLHALLPDWLFQKGLENVKMAMKDQKNRSKLKKYYKNGTSMLAPSTLEDWDNVILTNATNMRYKNKSIYQISKENQIDILDALHEVIISEGLAILVVLKGMNEDDVQTIAKHPLSMVGSDGGVSKEEDRKIHPRYYGTYPRYLKKFVLENKILRLEDAIRKMTSFPANKFGIKDRGLLKEGFYADINIFDPKMIKDNATLQEPNKFSEGIEYVIINGKIVLNGGKIKRKYPGRVLRK
ncbi:MAG: D-aminoacylase (Aspartate, glutamate ETC) [Promethearchaeota archaeon]|nr:MAG: D-aminoacylase (Aspartate, glutamate ETC) [Candidatus Lokiarchaeota archaeon]